MLLVMDSITDKSEWHRKVLDSKIMQKWKAEAMGLSDGYFTERTWQYCADELVRKAKSFDKQEFSKTLDTSQTIVKADHCTW